MVRSGPVSSKVDSGQLFKKGVDGVAALSRLVENAEPEADRVDRFEASRRQKGGKNNVVGSVDVVDVVGRPKGERCAAKKLKPASLLATQKIKKGS